MKKIFFISLFLVLGLFVGQVTNSAMSGGDYEITVDSFTVFEDGLMTGGDYSLYESGGDQESGTFTGGDYALWGGFLQTASGTLSFSLDSDSVSLGTLALDSVANDSVVATISVGLDSGYTLSATEDGDLRTAGGLVIDDVADGTVTAGSEEYGISTTGGGGQLATDTAIDGTVTVAYSSSDVTNQETTINFDAAISQSSVGGSYSHVVTFTLTANP